MKLGVIADDFTGATDMALTLADEGMSVSQIISVPDSSRTTSADAAVVSLKTRTAPVHQAVAQSLLACDWLLAQGADQIVLKVCSTFDSTAEGNIGPVLEALAEQLDAQHVFVCPAFPENGRSVYQGHLFVNDTLLNESGMQNHPLTPMTDPDVRRILAQQTSWPVAHIGIDTVSRGAGTIVSSLPVTSAMIVLDAIRDEDLRSIGSAAKYQRLLCGGSGIGLGLPANFGIKPSQRAWEPVTGPGVVISGSCSRATRRQVVRYKESNAAFDVTADDVMSGRLNAETLAGWAASQDGTPLVYSTADPSVIADAQEKFGTQKLANAIEDLFAQLAMLLVNKGTRRLVVAGGETSGAVTEAIGTWELEIGPKIAPGVPAVRAKDQNVALALKSGNFGDEDFFKKALDVMAGRST